MHEPEIADFEVVAAHQLQYGDQLLDLGTELRGRVVMLKSEDLSEPGDAALAIITVDLCWRGDELTRTTIHAELDDLRIIARRPQ